MWHALLLQNLAHLLLLLRRLRKGPWRLQEVTRQVRAVEWGLGHGCPCAQLRAHQAVLLQLHPLLQRSLAVHLLHELDSLPLLLFSETLLPFPFLKTFTEGVVVIKLHPWRRAALWICTGHCPWG